MPKYVSKRKPQLWWVVAGALVVVLLGVAYANMAGWIGASLPLPSPLDKCQRDLDRCIDDKEKDAEQCLIGKIVCTCHKEKDQCLEDCRDANIPAHDCETICDRLDLECVLKATEEEEPLNPTPAPLPPKDEEEEPIATPF